jgi:hypothetical protein
VRSFSGIFITDIYIFLTDDDCTIFEFHSEVHIFERHWYHATTHIEHLTHDGESLLIVTTTDIDECGEEDIPDLVPTDDSLFSCEAIFEESTYHLGILRESSYCSAHVSWGEDAVFISYCSGSATIIRDRDDRRYVIVEITLESVEHIECTSATADSDDIYRHT